MMRYDLICIGSGPAGQRAAVQTAKLGRRALVIERRGTVGGVCVDTGTIPSKTFREAVISLASPATLAGRGVARGHTRPSAPELLARVDQVMRKEADVISNQLGRNGVEVVMGKASFEDAHTVRVDTGHGEHLFEADNILIAVGTVPTQPPNAVADGDLILTSDDVGQIARVPQSLTVVGAGVIGVEYASMFAALGVNVTLIDRRDRPLEFLDTEIVDELLHQLRKMNVAYRPNEGVASVEVLDGPTKRVAITTESGKRIVSDMVLFTVGRVGATMGLGLERAGIVADDRGRLTVDDCYRTTVKHIYAVGDVIGYPSLAATSGEQGRLAACHAFGAFARPMSPHFPIGLYAIPEVSMVGAPEHELTKNRIPYEVGVARYREIARGNILGDESGFLKLLFHRDDRRLLGVHIMGTGATELLHIGQAVFGLGAGLDYFLDTVFNYPTLAECYKVAALNAANKFAR
ncbi:MAG: Si-specific NAD(P)(+) transhydrogenase [bacterium]